MNNRTRNTLATTVITLVLLVGCNFPGRTPTDGSSPTPPLAGTVDALLTQAVPQGEPSAPVIGTLTPSPTNPSATLPTAEGSCTDRARFIADATINDGTLLDPEVAFLKVWTLENAGTCTWSRNYSLNFFAGDRMGASAETTLAQPVEPGARVDLAIDLVAPAAPGVYQGFWRLKNAAGAYFGIGPDGDQSFWVKIVVPAPPTKTETITASPTGTPSPTSTPSVAPVDTSTPTLTPSPTETATPEP
jgi:hypothetical protein